MNEQDYNRAVMTAFRDELEKQASLAGLGRAASAVGSRVLGWAGKGAKALGKSKQFGAMRGAAGRALGGQEGLARATGAATMIGGAGLAAGGLAGRATAPRR